MDGSALVNVLRNVTRLFRGRTREDAEDLASETMVRVLDKAASGISIESLDAYARAVARNVWLEELRRRARSSALAEALSRTGLIQPPSREREIESLERCMAHCLKRSEARMIQAYYACAPHEAAAKRAEMARKMGISENALRLRALHARRKLFECMSSHASKGEC